MVGYPAAKMKRKDEFKTHESVRSTHFAEHKTNCRTLGGKKKK